MKPNSSFRIRTFNMVLPWLNTNNTSQRSHEICFESYGSEFYGNEFHSIYKITYIFLHDK